MILHGDCRDVLADLEPDSCAACCTDPPYEISFMGRAWDRSGVAFQAATWAAVLRVLKPGAHLVAFGGTRTYHRMVCAIEDAGFEIRDQLAWVYGSGFPKSLDVSKAIDRRKDWAALTSFQRMVRVARTSRGISQSEAARRIGMIGLDETLGGGGFMWFETGMRLPNAEQYAALKRELSLSDECDGAFEAAEREVIGEYLEDSSPGGFGAHRFTFKNRDITAPATEAARQWTGWGTALKPAWEPIVLARKPLSKGTVAANVLRWGTGALNIDACRIPSEGGRDREGEASQERRYTHNGSTNFAATPGPRGGGPAGRWPANLAHDGSPEVLEAFARFGESNRPNGRPNCVGKDYDPVGRQVFGVDNHLRPYNGGYEDIGTAAQFFYTAKAAAWEREGDHPTVKPSALMEWLVRLVTPPGGKVLDPFAGTGSTLVACDYLGLDAVGIEQDAKTCAAAETKIKRLRARRLLGDIGKVEPVSPNQMSLW